MDANNIRHQALEYSWNDHKETEAFWLMMNQALLATNESMLDIHRKTKPRLRMA